MARFSGLQTLPDDLLTVWVGWTGVWGSLHLLRLGRVSRRAQLTRRGVPKPHLRAIRIRSSGTSLRLETSSRTKSPRRSQELSPQHSLRAVNRRRSRRSQKAAALFLASLRGEIVRRRGVGQVVVCGRQKFWPDGRMLGGLSSLEMCGRVGVRFPKAGRCFRTPTLTDRQPERGAMTMLRQERACYRRIHPVYSGWLLI